MKIRELQTARGHMMPPLLHVLIVNGLARPAEESMLVWDNGTDIGTTGHSENITAFAAHSCRGTKRTGICTVYNIHRLFCICTIILHTTVVVAMFSKCL